MPVKPYKSKETQYGFFRSKVARRIFLLFILCALIPLSALAYFSFTQVTKHLLQQAELRLYQENKLVSLTIYERLLFLEMDLEMIIPVLKKGITGNVIESSSKQLQERLKERFRGIILVYGKDKNTTLMGSIKILPQWGKEEQQHMNAGRTLILTHPNTEKYASIFMVRALDPAKSTRVLLGEINPEYLWGGEGYLPAMTELLAFDQSNNVLFSTYPEYYPLQEMKTALQNKLTTRQFIWTHKDNTYLASYRTLFMLPQFHDKWRLVLSQSKADILSPLNQFKMIFKLLVILTFLLVLFLSIRQIRRSLVPIETLRDATRRIAAKDFGTKVKIKTHDEFEELGESFNKMADSIENHIKIMTTINRIGIALSAERDNNRLLELILLGAKTVTNADGCALYTLTNEEELKLSVMHIDSINSIIDSSDNISVALRDKEGNPNTGIVAAYSVLNDKTINIPDIYASEGFDFSGNHDFDKKTGYHSQSFLSVPMKNHENEITGVLQLTNAKDRLSHTVIPFSEEDQRLVETLASQAAVALSKNILIEDFKRLFDSLIELIAKAIDEKSPYTGDHCRRVPELTMMLAEAISKRKDGIFKDLSLNEEELYELKVAALLHDCGKVTTPVHIVDKATRLQTIFDRIYMIDARFEVVKRDAQVDLLQKKLAALNGMDSSALEEEMHKTLNQIDEDRDFVRYCNAKEDILPERFQERLKEIAQKYTWINSRGEDESIISEDELHNLISAVGTLTPEERKMLNQHVVTTIKMLESLPYPKSLRNVPKFAEAHHERMDGSGYPKGLKREQIPVQGRIIAIADIFEALTAKNRPYKKGRTLMQALRVLGSMKQDGQIDPDLFDVFISEKIYLQYAEKYLSPEQIDKVDLSQIPGYTPQKK